MDQQHEQHQQVPLYQSYSRQTVLGKGGGNRQQKPGGLYVCGYMVCAITGNYFFLIQLRLLPERWQPFLLPDCSWVVLFGEITNVQ